MKSATGTTHQPPCFDAQEAARLGHRLWGLEAHVTSLPSERDQNFALDAGSAGRFVLKISQSNESEALLRAQDGVLERLATAQRAGAETLSRYQFPRVRPTRNGERLSLVRDADGQAHFVRLFDFVPGQPLARVRPHTPALLRDVGHLIGSIDRALFPHDEAGVHRELHWDLRRAADVIRLHAAALGDAQRTRTVRRFLALLDANAQPLAALRTSVIHGDGNDWNVLVHDADPDQPDESRSVSGIIDLGDIVHSWTIGDLAVACAYAMFAKHDPLAAAEAVVNGYHEAFPVPEHELAALYPLIGARLCTSVVLAAHQRARRPDNAYLSISEGPAWALLERLADIPAEVAHATFRAACGFAPSSFAPRVTAWLDGNRARFGPLLGSSGEATGPMRFAGHAIAQLDLTVAGAPGGHEPGHDLLRAACEAARASGATVLVGRHGEATVTRIDDTHRTRTDEGPEWRNVRLGTELHTAAGTPVFLPFPGTVREVHDGVAGTEPGVVTIVHETGDGDAFVSIWRGLERHKAGRIAAGARVDAGTCIGHVAAHPAADRSSSIASAATHVTQPSGRLLVQLASAGLERVPESVRPRERAVWLALSPDPAPLLGLPPAPEPRPTSRDELLARRARHVGAALSISYASPLVIVRGWMQHLYDENGRAYLDAVNNVAHVGHEHPRVVEALHEQALRLNTNTRYLHEQLIRYAERLVATLPEPLRVCYFVCSGSEANELALRMARAHTRRRDVIVLDAAYHGNTTSLIEMSPYKFRGPGGQPPPPSVHVAPLPDPYRGVHRGDESGPAYVADVCEILQRMHDHGTGPAAFFAEPLPGCGGQIVPPAAFLAGAFAAVREAGGVCVADEVQTGLGRVGSHMWAFETQQAVPDIVTIGKPIGNGHPLAAVVTTAEVAASFANGMEYFNTFGGNPVSCAVGLAVLDVIEQERLQHNAARTGQRLLDGLAALRERHPIVGDVRGLGLYVGVELVRDRSTRTPAGATATHVANRMRTKGILLSTDGPDHNVLKIKPPLVFNEADADRLVDTLDTVLGEDAIRAATA